MKKSGDLHRLSTSELVKRFTDIGLQQSAALMGDDVKTFNKLYWKMDAIVKELKSRPGDERRALIVLYDHADLQVRYKAAVNTLALNFDAARRVIEGVSKRQPYPHAGEAGMTLEALDRGDFKPT